jgi:hypothetical protein
MILEGKAGLVMLRLYSPGICHCEVERDGTVVRARTSSGGKSR